MYVRISTQNEREREMDRDRDRETESPNAFIQTTPRQLQYVSYIMHGNAWFYDCS